MEQPTNSKDPLSINFGKSNQATDCGLSTLSVGNTVDDKDSGKRRFLADGPNPDLFEIKENSDGSVSITIRERLPSDLKGSYSLSVTETSAADSTDTYTREVSVSILDECTLCSISAPAKLEKVSELD